MTHEMQIRFVKALERIAVAMRGPQNFGQGTSLHEVQHRGAEALELIADAMEHEAATHDAESGTPDDVVPVDPIEQTKDQIAQALAAAPAFKSATSNSPMATNAAAMPAVPRRAPPETVGFQAPPQTSGPRPSVADLGEMTPPTAPRTGNGVS